MNYAQHALSAAFPAMSADDLQALTDDISVNGQREPIVIFEGAVLDGWHRYQSCMSLGWAVDERTLPDDEDPVAYVKSVNLKRRHLTGSQRSAAIVACSEWHPAHREKKSVATTDFRAPTSAQLAKEADVSISTITHAKAAHTAGVGNAVRDGRISAERGAQIAKLPVAERAAAVDAPKPAKPLTATAKQAEAARNADEAFGDFDPLAELQSTQKEVEVLQAQLTAAEADDQKAETLKWKRLHQVAERRQGEAMDTAHRAQKGEKWIMDQLRRCGKAVGEDDTAKIALAVERAVAAIRSAA